MSAKVWITRALSEEELALAKSLGLEVLISAMIRIQPVDDLSEEERANALSHEHWVFTSRNAVNALLELMGIDAFAGKQLWVVGASTASALPDGLPIHLPEHADGTHLAQLILQHKVSTLIHFCGNRRRDELQDILTTAGVDVQELTVYETQLLLEPEPEHLLSPYVAAWSPSAVEALAELVDPSFWLEKKFVAIGPTTAQTLTAFGATHITLSNERSTEGMLHTLASLIHNNKTHELS